MLAIRELPAPLREAQARAILAMLSQRLLASLKEMAMDVDKIPETKASRAFRLFFEQWAEARGEAKGKRECLLVVLAARGLSPTTAERATIGALTDLAALDRCIQVAVTAESVRAALAGAATVHHRRAASPRAPKRRTVKNGSRRPRQR